ncbi:MAG: polymorphic toxin-type HINT domain-containing protein [Pseudanabaena sp. ELA645]
MNFADQWVAGFAHAVSFGQTTRYRNWAYGEVANQNHQGFLWNMGMLSGISVSFLTGLRVVQTLKFGMGTAQWLAVAHTAGSTFTAAYDAGSRVREKGLSGLEWQDTFLLLPFIPYAASAAKTFIANAKAVNGSLKNWGQMKVGSSAKPVGKPVTGECFVAGTEILTTEGIKNIEDIKVGDWVIADDPNTVGEIEAKQVLDAFVRHTNKLVDLYIDGELISTTEEHPFWTPDRGWVEAKDLHVGSLLQTEDGRIIDVDSVDKREGDFTVYNFKVEGFHTYFVSDLGILVHNAFCFDGITPESVLQGMSNSNLKHSKKHLSEFQSLDPNITENSLRELGASIVKPENLISGAGASQKVFEQVVDIGGVSTRIRVALNELNKLHSVHIRY